MGIEWSGDEKPIAKFQLDKEERFRYTSGMSKNNSRTRRDERRQRAADRIDANLADYKAGKLPDSVLPGLSKKESIAQAVEIKRERAETTLENTERNMEGFRHIESEEI